MNFFVIDSPLMRFLAKIGDLLVLNLVFVVTCIPVVTIGTALSALFTVTMKIVRDESPSVLKEYMKAYKRNLKPATICWVIMVAAGLLIFLDFRLIAVFDTTIYQIARFVLAVILGIWALIFLYLFPYIARFENTIPASFKNALFLSAVHIPSTLMMMGLTVGSVILTLFTSRSFVIATIVWVFIGFSLLSYVQSFLLCRIFKKYE